MAKRKRDAQKQKQRATKRRGRRDAVKEVKSARKTRVMRCPAPDCKAKKTKGPRYNYYCEQHRYLSTAAKLAGLLGASPHVALAGLLGASPHVAPAETAETAEAPLSSALPLPPLSMRDDLGYPSKPEKAEEAFDYVTVETQQSVVPAGATEAPPSDDAIAAAVEAEALEPPQFADDI